MKKERIESYLIDNIDKLEKVVDDVVQKLPSRAFYYPEINSDEFACRREKMNMVLSAMFSSAYRNDRNISGRYKRMLREYETKLDELVKEKRRVLRKNLLKEVSEGSLERLADYIYEYNLLSRLRVYR